MVPYNVAFKNKTSEDVSLLVLDRFVAVFLVLCSSCFLFFFSSSLLGRHQLSNAVISPSETPKERESSRSFFRFECIAFWSVSQSVCRCSVARQFVILANHERSTAKKEREKESEPGWFRYRCQSCFRFFRSLSLSFFIYLGCLGYFFFSFDCRCLLVFQLLRHF